MPSNYTPNYQLNQWEADDRVLRTDFNADNAKIDAAIKAQADGLAAEKKALNTEKAAREAAVKAEADARAALAAELRPRAGAQLITEVILKKEKISPHVIPMSGFNWNEWFAIFIEVILMVPAGSFNNIHLYVNDNPVGNLILHEVDLSGKKQVADVFMLFPFYNEQNFVRVWPMTDTVLDVKMRLPIRFHEISELKINSGSVIGEGTSYRIWGLR